jgi:hypothetical protein
MTTSNRYHHLYESTRMREALVKWLENPGLNIFATVTLKRALLNDNGQLNFMTRADATRTAWLLRDRLTKKIVGSQAFRRGDTLPFLTFIEGNRGTTRLHIHIVTTKPVEIPLQDYRGLFTETARKLDWVHSLIDVRPIDYPDTSGQS